MLDYGVEWHALALPLAEGELQTERASATSEVNGRLQLYMSTLSASLITLALAAQLSDAGEGFRVFALPLAKEQGRKPDRDRDQAGDCQSMGEPSRSSRR